MSGDNSTSCVGSMSRTNPSSSPGNENDSSDPLIQLPAGPSPPSPPSRAPLNSIPDPSQIQHDLGHNNNSNNKEKSASGAGTKCKSDAAAHTPPHSLTPTTQKLQQSHQLLVVSNSRPNATPRRGPKPTSDPTSAPATPASSSKPIQHPLRISNVGPKGAIFSRGISVPCPDPHQLQHVPHFDLPQDHSFWKHHNVQVLIRIRPIRNIEKVSQGYARCLRQETAKSLVWLGHPETRFTFDHIACETISQEKLFTIAGLPMVDNCMSGYNSCMFAYGQTGSGKTHTMMGDIGQMAGKLNEDCGITPRIFEYLFTRISEEENNRRNEGLKYSCKCSFLEIYNEQITDLLEPSSTNLQLREDLKKGVYVENLTEYSVRTVDDVLRLLLQGAANRKIAATHMNSESSRSHSVFTCIIESRWEKDSMTHIRFGRLNLVDLAGSERQKSSGAEGDRLKEAANINKSLSTLGLVIMSLVDLAQGKNRHVPYRDSRLTFLLQDSLGGNSKTTIIANVSPSICSANETLSTLKFAQRAKLIQNNAKVNEDASGDVIALQRQIQQLKGQLSILSKHSHDSEYLSNHTPSCKESYLGTFLEELDSSEQMIMHDNHGTQSGRRKKVTIYDLNEFDALHMGWCNFITYKWQTMCSKATLLGALRRENLAELEVKRLKAEMEQLNSLVHQLELDAQHAKMILRSRDERIKHLELLADGFVSADAYILNENNALREEIGLLQSRIGKNPELTRSALENIRLLEQLRLFKEFYGQGERETLLAEISELRDELSDILEAEESCVHSHSSPCKENQETRAEKELNKQRDLNSNLVREVDELQRELGKFIDCNLPTSDSSCLQAREMLPRSCSVDELASCILQEECASLCEDGQHMERALVLQCSEIQKELKDARSVIEAMESKQLCLIEELEFLRNENDKLMETLQKEQNGEGKHRPEPEHCNMQSGFVLDEDLNFVTEGENDSCTLVLQAKLVKLSKDLQHAQLLNSQYLKDHATGLSQQSQAESIQEDVEIETARTILHLQEEIATLQSELQGRTKSLEEENRSLRNCIAAKDGEMEVLCSEWERATLELTNFLLDGSKSIGDASSQIESIGSLFPCDNVWVSEHVERAAKLCVEKEESMFLLKRSLEDAQTTVLEMDQKLNSLRGATMVLSEAQQIEHLESNLIYHEGPITEVKRYADYNFLEMKTNFHQPMVVLWDNVEKNVPSADAHTSVTAEVNADIELAHYGLLEAESAISISRVDAESHFMSLQSDIHETFSLYKELIQDLVNDIHDMRRNFVKLNVNYGSVDIHTSGSPLVHTLRFLEHENGYNMLHQILGELAEVNKRLNSMNAYLSGIVYSCQSPAEVNGWTTDFSSSNSSADSGLTSKQIAVNRYGQYLEKKTEQTFDLEPEESFVVSSKYQESGHSRLVETLDCDRLTSFCLRKEFRAAYDALSKINDQLTAIFSVEDTWDGSTSGVCFTNSHLFITNKEHHFVRDENEQVIMPNAGAMIQSHEEITQMADASCSLTREADSFFSKFEEAQATVKEADYMLNALLKSNDDAKQLTSAWKQVGNELMIQKANLFEEVNLLKSSIHFKESENEMLQHQIHFILTEIASLMFLIEGSFQKDVEDLCKTSYCDTILMVKETLNNISSLRSLLEEISAEVRENGIISFVFNERYLGKIYDEIRRLNKNSDFLASTCEGLTVMQNSGKESASYRNESEVKLAQGEEEGCQYEFVNRSEAGEDDLINEHLELKREVERKEVLLKGLLFDLSLLQESASSTKEAKDEIEKLHAALNQVRNELKMKTSQLDNMLIKHKTLEGRLMEAENALCVSHSDLEEVRGTLDILSEENAELRMLLKDVYLKKSETEQQLEEQRESVKDLEDEILRMASSAEEKMASSIKDIKDDMKRVTAERNQLLDQLQSLQDKLDIAYAVADEKEAIALEACQESEASKVYAEQKEEEVKILEHSVEELDSTINVLEKKVSEMEEEVERYRQVRDSLEVELHGLRERLLMVESITEDLDSSRELSENQFLRSRGSVELHEALSQIRILEEEKDKLAKEIKQYREYISEVVVHAEAQASQYQQKYKSLEAMIHEVRTDSSDVICGAPTLDKTEKTSVRSRGSSSPFRCIASLVQQMNMEKDQELSIAKFRIEELEALVASRQKEVCLLNTRLASVESMTHDVIRDLLGVKLDITNYADLVSQNRLQKLVEEAQHQAKQYIVMEKEVLELRRRINDLVEERERCVLEVNRREADVLATHMILEQVRERDQLLSAQNEMLKADKTNLQRRVAELDDMVKKLIGRQNIVVQKQQQTSSFARLKG
nr:kinesin-like protein KIN-12E isoform X3 [Coffea arabica]